ncbi:MAG: hypothetical protein RKR03_09175 [Candidatus Competibacter sp.]|nr:hypothetical protein [Candidatus Competibacter sp.]MDS4059837.1 hypothetical protein [Candidatus Contendobacter sp.]
MTDDTGMGKVAEPAPQLTRRRADYDTHELACFIHRLDTRVSVLETRMTTQDDRLSSIEEELRDANLGVQRVLDCLQAHTRQEDQDRVKLLGFVVATLLSVLGFAGAAMINHLLR